MFSWKAIKKRIRSKTYHVASVMLSIGVTVETYSPEIKQVVADKIGVSWGIAYAIMFALSMQVMREITKEPISAKGDDDVKESDERDDRDDQDMDDCDFDDRDGTDGVMGLIPKPIGDTDTQGGCESCGEREAILREVTKRAKRVNRGKRRR